MRSKPPPRVYVIETNSKSLVAFEAVSGREANVVVIAIQYSATMGWLFGAEDSHRKRCGNRRVQNCCGRQQGQKGGWPPFGLSNSPGWSRLTVRSPFHLSPHVRGLFAWRAELGLRGHRLQNLQSRMRLRCREWRVLTARSCFFS